MVETADQRPLTSALPPGDGVRHAGRRRRAWGERARPIGLGLLTVAAVAATARPVAGQDQPLRGPAFELGAVLGGAGFQNRTDLASCTWFGGRAGHRFAPFAGAERFQLTFRAGWEACLTDHADIGRVDLVFISTTWLFGYRLTPRWMVYWGTGLGMLLGDSTPGDDNQVIPRFGVSVGPGVTRALTRHLFIDVSVFSILFEDFGFGQGTGRGTRIGFIPNVMVAIQI